MQARTTWSTGRPFQACTPSTNTLHTGFAAQSHGLPPAAWSYLLEAGLPDCHTVMQEQRCPAWCSGKLPHGSCAIWTAHLLEALETRLACALPFTILYFGKVKKKRMERLVVFWVEMKSKVYYTITLSGRLYTNVVFKLHLPWRYSICHHLVS